MTCTGFTESRYNPTLFDHPGRNIRVLVHGDEFMSVAARRAAQWFKERLAQRITIKTQIVGPGKDEVPEARLLGRVVRSTTDGWE